MDRRRHLCVLVAASVAASGWTSVRAESAIAPKDHVLFVGTSFMVVQQGKSYPVVGAGDRTFIVDFGNRTKECPLRELPDIQIARGLRLTNVTASIDEVNATLSSDAANADIMEAAQTSIALSSVATINRDREFGKMIDADITRGSVSELMAEKYPNMGLQRTIAIADSRVQDAKIAAMNALDLYHQQTGFSHEIEIESAAATANSGNGIELTPEVSDRSIHLVVAGEAPHPAGTSPTGSQVGSTSAGEPAKPKRHVIDRGDGHSDRFDLEFTLSAREPIESAYIVVVTEYTAPKYGAKVFRRVLAQHVDRIDATPRKIHLYQTFFPEGFHLRTYTMDLYANGQEVATNVSETKMTLTRDEAYEYLVVDYLAAHKGQTLPPAAILMAGRSQLQRTAPLNELRQPLYVSVNDKGELVTVSTSAHKVSKPPESLIAALGHFRFIPAIEKGVPIGGRAKLILAEFAQ